jgi:hypothetical protein
MELYKLYTVANISWAIKSRNVEWEKYLLRKRHKKCLTTFYTENYDGRRHFRDMNTDGKIK